MRIYSWFLRLITPKPAIAFPKVVLPPCDEGCTCGNVSRGTEDDDDDGYQFTRWERFMMYSRFTSWVGFWLTVGQRKVAGVYDGLMIRFWPYDRHPREWRDLFRRGDVPRETTKE